MRGFANALPARPLRLVSKVSFIARTVCDRCYARDDKRPVQPARGVVAIALAAFTMSTAIAAPADDDPVGNWFNDPFFQVRSAIGDCPTPAGPMLPRSQIRLEEHSRAERGTSCWLAGKCDRPNAYQHDAEIGRAVKERFSHSPQFSNSTLWITVKRKFVWVEGCLEPPQLENTLRDFVAATPGVEMVFVDVRKTASGKIPYAIQAEPKAPR